MMSDTRNPASKRKLLYMEWSELKVTRGGMEYSSRILITFEGSASVKGARKKLEEKMLARVPDDGKTRLVTFDSVKSHVHSS